MAQLYPYGGSLGDCDMAGCARSEAFSFTPLPGVIESEGQKLLCMSAILSRKPVGAAGNLFLSETATHIHLYELMLGPNLDMRQTARLQLPDDGGEVASFASATWAPDSSTVLLLRASYTLVC